MVKKPWLNNDIANVEKPPVIEPWLNHGFTVPWIHCKPWNNRSKLEQTYYGKTMVLL